MSSGLPAAQSQLLLLCWVSAGMGEEEEEEEEKKEEEKEEEEKKKEVEEEEENETKKAGNVRGEPIPPSFLDLLKWMLELDPNQRITPRKVLKHPFFCQESQDQPSSTSPVLQSPSVDRGSREDFLNSHLPGEPGPTQQQLHTDTVVHKKKQSRVRRFFKSVQRNFSRFFCCHCSTAED
ncbi:hypothetical protein CRUP_008519 [Coryphaenoides rupestris]|nr:hypothetical protein CRUP_008519 [Coryphaenoides rupestris]